MTSGEASGVLCGEGDSVASGEGAEVSSGEGVGAGELSSLQPPRARAARRPNKAGSANSLTGIKYEFIPPREIAHLRL